jgi:hypothetical protein
VDANPGNNQPTKIMKPIKSFAVAMAGLVLAAASSHAVLLTYLLQPGATIQVGDKIFGNFTWDGTGGPGSAAGINVTGIGDGTSGSLYGIQFGGGLSQVGTGTSDWQLGYSVTIAPGYDNYISDIHQYANFGGTLGSYVNITEDVLDAPGGNSVATSHLGEGINYAYIDQTDPPAELNDSLVLGTPLQQVWIEKDIQLRAFSPSDDVSMSILQQRFSQVPEPTTAGCFLLGLGALVCCQRFTKNRRS